MIKAVLIDIDDTLLDFHAYVREALELGFKEFGLGEFDEDTFAVFTRVNNAMWRSIERGEITLKELMATRFNNVFAALGITGDGVIFEKFFRDRLNFSAIPVDGAMEMLEYLSGKYILCTASNGPYHQQLNRLEIGGMKRFFSHFFVSEAIGASKPSKEFFDFCLNELEGIAPEEMMIIGDSPTSDIAGGKAAGMKTCFFDKKRIGAEAAGADYTINSLRDIKSIL